VNEIEIFVETLLHSSFYSNPGITILEINEINFHDSQVFSFWPKNSSFCWLMEEAKNIHDFLRFCYTLKKTKRTGWVKNGVELPESIADHLFGITLMALVIPVPHELDRSR
jgi:hypothetical protein